MLRLMTRTMDYIMCLLSGGPYIVSEDMSFGQFARREHKARFYNLARAKAFAKSMIPQMGRMVVLDGISQQPLYVYRQKR